ncbi:MAG: energy-coupled thiamine transporter ThiT [Candidatus Muiribacteriota bacterium]
MKNKKLVILLEIAITAALALILSKFFRLYKMPQGGSVTLEMLPLAFFAYRRGFSQAMFAGFIYSIVSIIFIDNPIMHFFQPVLDYVIPSLVMAICGFGLKKDIYVKEFLFVIAFMLRLISHVVSGVIFYGQYAPEGTSAFMYSFIYNITYLLPSAVAVMIIIYVFDRRKLFKN